MKIKRESFLLNITVVFIILAISFFVSLSIHLGFKTDNLITPIFVLAVFLISLNTYGYIYGILSALLSVLAVNYAFAFPYFAFNFTIQENIISAIILICVTLITSTLTTKIKRQKELKLQAEKEKMRANLLRAVSHDLRTPLTSIYGSASTVYENYNLISEKDKVDILNGIQNDAKWLIRMVENILSVTRIDNNNIKIARNSVVLEELIGSAISKIKKNYPDVRVNVDMPEEFLLVSADPLLIEQVLINFLENAIIHAKGMTKLELKVTKMDEKVLIEVIDNGCGMSKEKLKKLFTDYFVSEDTVLDSQKNCMGIGLSVCATIIKAHGEEIIVKRAKDKGMIFGFYLEAEEEII